MLASCEKEKEKAEHPGACSALEGTDPRPAGEPPVCGCCDQPRVLAHPHQPALVPSHIARAGWQLWASLSPLERPGSLAWVTPIPMGHPEVRFVEKGSSCLAVLTYNSLPPHLSTQKHLEHGKVRPWASWTLGRSGTGWLGIPCQAQLVPDRQ